MPRAKVGRRGTLSHQELESFLLEVSAPDDVAKAPAENAIVDENTARSNIIVPVQIVKSSSPIKASFTTTSPAKPAVSFTSNAVATAVEHLQAQAQAQKDLDDYKRLTEERFNKLVNMITQK